MFLRVSLCVPILRHIGIFPLAREYYLNFGCSIFLHNKSCLQGLLAISFEVMFTESWGLLLFLIRRWTISRHSAKSHATVWACRIVGIRPLLRGWNHSGWRVKGWLRRRLRTTLAHTGTLNGRSRSKHNLFVRIKTILDSGACLEPETTVFKT